MAGFDKISTGTSGLDTMLHGGIISGRPYILSGGPGLGKTLLSLQFLLSTEPDEKGLFITLDEPVHELKQNMREFGWDPEQVHFLDCTPTMGLSSVDTDSYIMIRSPKGVSGDFDLLDFSVTNLVDVIRTLTQQYKIRRVAIDSLSSIKLMIRDEFERRKTIQLLMESLSQLGLTTLLITEVGDTSGEFYEFFLARGVVQLKLIEMQNRVKKALQIVKMRSTPFDDTPRPLVVSSEGVEVFPDETIF